MDTQAVKMLAKELHAWKRKEKALGESSKKAKVDALSSATLTATAVASKVAKGNEVIPAAEVGAVDRGSVPPSSSSPPAEDQASQPSARREKGEKKKRKEGSMGPTTIMMIKEKTPSAI